MRTSLVVPALLLSLFGSAYSKWDGLRVTFGRDPTTFFRAQPRTVSEATAQGFVPVGDDSCTESPHYNGRAYVKNGDYSITLLYDTNGFIAGIQAGIPVEYSSSATGNQSYPSTNIRPPFVLDGITDDRYTISAYFINPNKICTTGRSQTEFAIQGTGENLWLQTGMYPNNVTLIPMQESQLGTPWVEGNCFRVMGKHYWYNITQTMNCEEIRPWFLLYNGGELNAFGWAFVADIDSVNYEYPTPQIFPIFFSPVPHCLNTFPRISTMHIFLTANPFTNNC